MRKIVTGYGLLNQAVAQRIGSDIRVGRKTHLFQYSASIGADGFHAEAEFIGDIRDAPTRRQLAKI